MNCNKQQALEIISRLHEENHLDNSDYCTVHDGLSEIEPLRDRDEVLEELWKQFGDIPMNPETECMAHKQILRSLNSRNRPHMKFEVNRRDTTLQF